MIQEADSDGTGQVGQKYCTVVWSYNTVETTTMETNFIWQQLTETLFGNT